jgi:acyl dehydratase
MSVIETKIFTVDQVAVGDDLPPLEVPVTATTVVLGALASRDWRPMHHDRDFAINRNGVKDIFINTPNNAAWFERYVTDWTGPRGRLGRMKFKMNSSVFPGDHMVMSGTVENISTDDTGCCWLDLNVAVSVEGEVSTSCKTRVAIPADSDDNPWSRKGDRWKP